MKEWRAVTLGDVVALQRGYDLPERKRVPGSVPVYGSFGITGYHDTAKAPGPGVLIGRSGASFGVVNYAPTAFWPHNAVLWVTDFKGNDPRFVSYLLKSMDFSNLNSGSAQPSLNRNYLYPLPVRCPDLDIQCRIASILSAYDDLIDNNSRRITILEEMAQMIYREWFVNFRFPGHGKAKMVESESGPIPMGWLLLPLGDAIQFHIGGGWGEDKGDDTYRIPAHVIRGTDIPAARMGDLGTCPLRFHKESNIASRKLQPGDLVFEVSGGSKGQPVGRALFIHSDVLSAFGGDVICASFCKLLRPETSKIGSLHLYEYLLDAYSNGQIEKYQVQSTGITNFKFAVFLEDAKIAVPSEPIRIEFENVCQPLVDAVVVLGRKNAVLRQTRDLLLPKLISGEVNVEQCEAEAVAQGV